VIVEGVDVNSDVEVGVFWPDRVGVFVKVGVATVGVEVGTLEGVIVLTRLGVTVSVGTKRICSSEQDETSNAQSREMMNLFMWDM
jgi:hypothetical protein